MLLGCGGETFSPVCPLLGWRETLSHQRPLPLPPQPAAEPDKYLRAGRLKLGFHLLDPGQWLPLHLVFFTLIPTEARPVSPLPTHTHLPPASAPGFPASSQQDQPQPRPSPEVSSAFLFSHWLLCSGVAPPPQVPEQSTAGFFELREVRVHVLSSCVSPLQHLSQHQPRAGGRSALTNWWPDSQLKRCPKHWTPRQDTRPRLHLPSAVGVDKSPNLFKSYSFLICQTGLWLPGLPVCKGYYKGEECWKLKAVRKC